MPDQILLSFNEIYSRYLVIALQVLVRSSKMLASISIPTSRDEPSWTIQRRKFGQIDPLLTGLVENIFPQWLPPCLDGLKSY